MVKDLLKVKGQGKGKINPLPSYFNLFFKKRVGFISKIRYKNIALNFQDTSPFPFATIYLL